MDEKLKSENMQKEQFSMFMLHFEQSGQAGVENGAMLTTYLFGFRMQYFVVKFSNFSSPQAARGHSLIPLTKILRRFLAAAASCNSQLPPRTSVAQVSARRYSGQEQTSDQL